MPCRSIVRKITGIFGGSLGILGDFADFWGVLGDFWGFGFPKNPPLLQRWTSSRQSKTLTLKCAHAGQPTCTHEAADVHPQGNRCAHAGQPMCTRGAADVHMQGIHGAADVHTRGNRCAHAGQP
eukprot:879910-Prorocentrum_minimum.AAC.1